MGPSRTIVASVTLTTHDLNMPDPIASPENAHRAQTNPQPPLLDIDAIDRQLIAALAVDGRATHAELAEHVALSASAVLRRVRRLEALGIITGYHAIIDAHAVGAGTTVFVEVRLDSQREAVLDAFEAAAAEVPEIVACHLISGDADYLLRVQTAGVAGFERVHTSSLSRLPGVVQLRSYFAMRSVFDRSVVA